jgi:hypothetical protein
MTNLFQKIDTRKESNHFWESWVTGKGLSKRQMALLLLLLIFLVKFYIANYKMFMGKKEQNYQEFKSTEVTRISDFQA